MATAHQPKPPATRSSSATRSNNAKIDAYVQANRKEWSYIQSLPRERLERMLVSQNVNKIERRERVRASVMKQLEANPELKEA